MREVGVRGTRVTVRICSSKGSKWLFSISIKNIGLEHTMKNKG